MRLLGFVARLTDVTARRAAETALAQSEASHRLLADNSNDIIVRIGDDGRLRFVSQASLRVLGYTPEEVLGQNANLEIHPDDFPAVLAAFRLALNGGKSSAACYRQHNKDGRYIWLEAVYRRVIDPVSAECEVVASIRDVDQRRQAELLNIKRAALLSESNRLLTMAPPFLDTALTALFTGTAIPRPQDQTLANVFSGRTPAEGRIDWSWPARRIHNLVRAVTHPFPGASCTCDGQPLLIWRTRVVSDHGRHGEPGTMRADGWIACGDGGLDIIDYTAPNGSTLKPGARLA